MGQYKEWLLGELLVTQVLLYEANYIVRGSHSTVAPSVDVPCQRLWYICRVSGLGHLPTHDV